MDPETKKEEHTVLNDGDSINSVDKGAVHNTTYDKRNGQFNRSFTPRQVNIIALGSNIGSGLFISSGKALADGGPDSMLIAYMLVCSSVWAMLQTISEMTIMFSTSGSFVDYAARWVDPALAFGAGFAEWLGWTSVAASEAAFFAILIKFWDDDGSVPKAALLTMFLVACLVIFALPNQIFAWFEYVTSLVKLFAFFLITFVSLAVVCGAGPKGFVHHGSTWTDLAPFKNGFGGFASCITLAVFAVGDQVFIGVLGGEAQTPRYSMAHAAKMVSIRMFTIYSVSITFISLLVPSDDARLMGSSGATASPFIIAIQDAGIPVIPHIINVCIIVGVLAMAAEAIFLSSRILRTLAHQQLIPEFIAKVDDRGRPRWALAFTCAATLVLTYINLSAGGIVALNWLINITTTAEITNWLTVGFISFRFRGALKAQGDTHWRAQYSWKSFGWPAAPIWLLVTGSLYLAGCLFLGVTGDQDTTIKKAKNFFEYMIGILLIITATIAYKICGRTKWQSLATADCVTGHRVLTAEEVLLLDEYYKRPKWRRITAYLKAW